MRLLRDMWDRLSDEDKGAYIRVAREQFRDQRHVKTDTYTKKKLDNPQDSV